MNYSTYRFTLDIHHTKSQISIPIPHMDTAVQFFINLTDGGKPYKMEEGCTARLFGKKADGTSLVNDCDIIDNGTRIHYQFNEQTASVLGVCECELRLGNTGRGLTTPSFDILVVPRVLKDDEIIESESEKSAIDNLFISENERVIAEEARATAEQERIENENSRIEAEVARDSAEKARESAEEIRKQNEIARGEAAVAREERASLAEAEREERVNLAEAAREERAKLLGEEIAKSMGIAQERGENPALAMSQKATNEAFVEVESRTTDLEYVALGAGSVGDAVYLQEGYEDGDALVLEDCESYGDSIVFTPLTHQSLVYELSANGTYYTVKSKGNVISKTLLIPDYYNGLPVKYIEDNAFKNDTTIVTAIIGRNIDRIGDSAFLGCTNLESLVLLRNAKLLPEGESEYDHDRYCDYAFGGSIVNLIRYMHGITDPTELANLIKATSTMTGQSTTSAWIYTDAPF